MTLEAALRLAEAGYYVLPGVPGKKRPYVKGGEAFGSASRDGEKIRSWWEDFPDAEILIATGPSGLVVFDIDGPAGEESFRDFYGPDTPAPPTPIAATPRKEGGRQVLFRAPADATIKGTVRIRPGLDIRAWGNVIVAPPAPGREWWHGCDPFSVSPAPLAEHVIPMLTVEEPQTAATAPTDDFERIIERVEGARRRGGYALGLCPAHNDRNPSLSVKQRHDGVSVKCFAGCSFKEIASALEARGMPRGLLGRKYLAPNTEAKTADPSDSLNPITAREIMATDYPPLRFLVAKLIVEGLTLLAGRPKIGKSWLALCLAVAVVFGGPFLGQTAATRAGVLYCALEDSPRRIKKRLLALGVSSCPEDLYFLFELARLDMGGAEVLDAWLAAHPDVRLVIIDVFNRIRGARPKNADPYAHDTAEMAKLQAVALRRGVALVVITHDRKAAAEDWLEKITGTLGVAGTADTVALLERDRGSSNGRLRVVGRDLDEEPDLALEFKEGLWHVVGPGETLELTPERRAILEALPTEGEGFSPTQVSLATGAFGRRISVNTIKHAVPALMRAGLVLKNRTGRYLHTPHTPYTEAPSNE